MPCYLLLVVLVLALAVRCVALSAGGSRILHCRRSSNLRGRPRGVGALSKLSASRADEVADDPQVSANISNLNKLLIDVAKTVLSMAFAGRPYPYFYALETIARVPYFAYVSVLHLYETLGLFRRKDVLLLHFSESWNESLHLRVMEDLGGGDNFSDRFIAQHLAFFYYWVVVIAYLSAPAVAYDFNHHVESHAADSYMKHMKENQVFLEAQPAPRCAVEYYMGDTFMLDSFQTSSVDSLGMGPEQHVAARSPPDKMTSLYDVFVEIAKDEREHALTMLLLSQDKTLRCWSKNECQV